MLQFEMCSSLRAGAGMEAEQETGDGNSAVLVLPGPLPPPFSGNASFSPGHIPYANQAAS